ncbi:MAG TPA: hypothetical protein VHB98_18650, partial [Chloroflexota bacterium]|nr:hypothetical protein [Chloroflexota bacterium]
HRGCTRPVGATGQRRVAPRPAAQERARHNRRGHFTWEDGADEYAVLVTNWWGAGYASAGSAAAR